MFTHMSIGIGFAIDSNCVKRMFFAQCNFLDIFALPIILQGFLIFPKRILNIPNVMKGICIIWMLSSQKLKSDISAFFIVS